MFQTLNTFSVKRTGRDKNGTHTFYRKTWAGCKLGHIHDLYGKLLLCLPVQASPHNAKRTPVE